MIGVNVNIAISCANLFPFSLIREESRVKKYCCKNIRVAVVQSVYQLQR